MSRQLFAAFAFDDPDAAIAFLTAVGFAEAGVYRDGAGTVVHAQFDWRDTGGVMFGAARRGDEGDADRAATVGRGACYCVCPDDAAVDAVHASALAAGASSVQAPTDMDYGGRGATVRDAEGNLWSFGSYPGS
ncbi:putative glyoxalase superfamily protein PhnB [Naumannella cuiyingiana]|uniref:Putative glyoxalase superfamily protein PhnB n=1 Tax=Naumannella cuiyingiana TaxID=1347891 RepID=A0A7Z0DAC3_9ACTN|nr:VOC family protein [Naumannella cuiyingiana]NYI71828.1 putative glyoxalase superfamily protein PhnB [Naumannella cuiyingiana]